MTVSRHDKDAVKYSDLLSRIQSYIESRVSDKYHNIKIFSSDGPAALFTSEWGSGNERRMIKTDGLPKTARAQRHFGRNLNTSNEVKISTSIPDAEMHNIVPILDYYEGEDGSPAIMVTRHYQGARRLDNIISDIKDKHEAPLSKMEWEDLIHNTLYSIKHYVDNGLLHRDIKPSNMLVLRKTVGGKSRLKSYLIDSANGGRIDEAVEEFMPTSGGHFVSDPILATPFTGKIRKHNPISELYSVGVIARFAANLGYGWEVDPDNNFAKILRKSKKTSKLEKVISHLPKLIRDVFSSEKDSDNLLDNKSIIDVNKYEQANKLSLSELPAHLKKYKNFLYRLNTLDESERFSSVDEAITAFENISNKETFREGWDRKYKYLAPFVALSGAVALYGAYALFNYFIETSKPEMDVKFNGKGLEISNNMFAMDVSAYSWMDEKSQSYPDDGQFLNAKRGKSISGYINATTLPSDIDLSNVVLDGAAYIEGFDKDMVNIYVGKFDQAREKYTDMYLGYSSTNYFDIDIPEDLPDGVYNLWLEIYAPRYYNKEKDMTVNNEKLAEVRLPEPGTIISRQRIPIFIGKENSNVYLSDLNLGYFATAFVEKLRKDNILEDVDSGIVSELSIPEMSYHVIDGHNPNGYSNYERALSFQPVDSLEGKMTLQIVSRNNGRIVNYNLIPLKEVHSKGELSDGYEYDRWDAMIDIPDSTFYRKAIEFRKELYSNQESKK